MMSSTRYFESIMNIFNKTLAVAVILSITSLTSNAENAKIKTPEKLTSAMGYPYKLLINRSDSVKITYSENNNKINCKVVVRWHEQEMHAKPKQVSKEKFNEKPLASCLDRNKAKEILAQTFR